MAKSTDSHPDQSSSTTQDTTAMDDAIEQALPHITELLREQTGHDFSQYKKSTLGRRIRRRMQMLQLNSLDAYRTRLQDHEDEVHLLVEQFLIGVTSFFRDSDGFEMLAREVIPRLFEQRTSGAAVRIWVPACSTGQEAYTIAMLCAEYAEQHDQDCQVQIFASDIDRRALATARRALYPKTIASEISSERLERFFRETSEGLEVVDQLKEMCLFSVHDVISDPPFSQLDLVSCRNLLIYLDTDLQKELLDTFHFALKPDAFLYLGPSETVSSNSELFISRDPNHRIFQRDNTSVVDHREGAAGRASNSPPSRSSLVAGMATDAFSQMQRIVLDKYSPRSVVVDNKRRVICTSGHTEHYLTLSRGSFENDILKMARSELRIGLRSALHTALEKGQKVVREDLSIETQDGIQPVRICVEPLRQADSNRDLFAVIFENVGAPLGRRESNAKTSGADQVIAHLEQELNRAHSDLDETVRELELSNEELHSSNEELLSMNEELQSANEEMETAKEEVQAANRELAQTNDDLENLLESTQIATIFLDRNLCIQRMTPAAQAIYNVKPADLGRPLTDVTHRVEEMPPLPAIEEVDTQLAPIEDELRTNDGRWFIRRVLPYRDNKNRKRGLVVTFVDNTDQRTAQNRASHLAAIVDSSDDAIIGKTLDGEVTSWNEAAEKMYGYTSQEMIGSHISKIIPPDRPHELQSILSRLKLGEAIATYHTRRVHKNGQLIDVALTISPVRDVNGKAIGASAIARDITDQIEREQMLEERNYALHNLNRVNRAIASSLDTDSLLQQITDHGRELVGAEFGAFFYNHEETMSYKLNAMSGLHEEQLARLPMPRATQVFKPIFDGVGTHRSDDITADPSFGQNPPHNGLPDGHPPVRSYLAAPVVSREGEVFGGLFFGHSQLAQFSEHDEQLLSGLAAQASVALANSHLYEQLQGELRERRETESRLEAAIEEAEAANESKSEFLANMSHEIRTPMTAILGYADVLMSHLQAPDDRQCVETIRRNGNYLLEIINDILDLSKIEAGKLEIEPQRVAPDHIVADVLSLMSIRASEKDLDLQVEFASELPETIATDPTRLRQVLVNLVGNAIKFTDEGRVLLRVDIQDDDPPRLKFDVLDTGVGMSTAELDALFEPFTQGKRADTTANSGGTGLGLAICRRLVRMLGGQISVQSEPNVGTTVSVTVDTGPLDDIPFIEPTTGIGRPRQPISVSSVELDCKVLVVDDRREIRFLAAHYLEEAGATVDTASNGREAIAAVKEATRRGSPYQIIVMDMQMPVMNGYQATKKLRRMGFSVPIIALTAAAMDSDRTDCLAAGCNEYVAKPIRADALTQLVARHIDDEIAAGANSAAAEPEADHDARREDKTSICRILLVEDNSDARQALEQLLSMVGGYEVESAGSGSEALEAARGASFDVALLDLGLPDMSGLELLASLQELEAMAETTFIALSGRSTPEDKRRSEEAGFAHHLVKPVSLSELREYL